MDSGRSVRHSVLLVFFAFLLVWGFSFLPISGVRKYDLFSDFRNLVIIKKDTSPEKKKNVIASESLGKTVGSNLKVSSNTGILDYGFEEKPSLQSFLEALSALKRKGNKVRIAYYGDSMIEGDLVTMTIRDSMQSLFGGSGVGWVPISSASEAFRKSILQTSDNFKTISLITPNPEKIPLGISGMVFLPKPGTQLFKDDNSRVLFKNGITGIRVNHFETVKLYYSNVYDSAEVFVKADEYQPQYITLDTGTALRILQLPIPKGSHQLELKFATKKEIYLHGISFESDEGISLDNFSLRGNSGATLGALDARLIDSFKSSENYDLLIFQYGLNVASGDPNNLSWYEIGFKKAIKSIQKKFPGTSILIISVSDKGFKQNGEIVTDPSIPEIVRIQEKIAQETGVAFFNLFNAMGGENTIKTWAEANPALAAKDYTHLNYKGAQKIGNLIFAELKNCYLNYNHGK